MRRILWVSTALVALTVLAIGMAYKIVRANAPTKAAVAVVKDIREHILVGASRSEVEAYLDQKGVRHSYVKSSSASSEYEHTEMAMIGGTSKTWLVRGDTQILFAFDDHDVLVNYTVREIFTGP